MPVDIRLREPFLGLCRQILRPSVHSHRLFSVTTKRPEVGGLGELGKSMSNEADLSVRSMFDSTESDPFDELLRGPTRPAPPHHLHVYATKHNCHITLTNPDRNSIISKSTGNIGFRKSARGTYDAAYQLSAYILGQIYEGGMLNNIKRLEVVLRGFGVGREAVTKALLGPEGRKLRPKIVQVTDATRLKFGGTRSPRPRRLG